MLHDVCLIGCAKGWSYARSVTWTMDWQNVNIRSTDWLEYMPVMVYHLKDLWDQNLHCDHLENMCKTSVVYFQREGGKITSKVTHNCIK